MFQGEKIFQQFKHIDQILKSRGGSDHLSDQSAHQPKESSAQKSPADTDLNNIVDKMQTVMQIEKENQQNENQADETKSKVKEAESGVSQANYFARPVKPAAATSRLAKQTPLVNKANNLNLNEVKEKVKQKLASKPVRTAQTIPFEECVTLLQQREKRVQEYQLEQTARKLIEGQSVAYDYSFVAKAENLR